MNKIPKIIHYCWVGGNPKPQSVLYCIESWKKYCPDYQIIEWNETNYDFTKNEYMHQAYEAKKWGFVPDYARLDIVYEHGGIYLDTDVEMVRSFDELLEHESFFGFEDTGENTYFVACGLGFGAAKHNELVKKLRDYYDDVSFLNPDGSPNLIPAPRHNTPVFSQYGIQMNNKLQRLDGNAFYPAEYFCPKIFKTGKLTRTQNTYSIHHFSASWMDDAVLKDIAHNQKICLRFGNRLGHQLLYLESVLHKYPIWRIPKVLLIRFYEQWYSYQPLLHAILKNAVHRSEPNEEVLLFDTGLGTANQGDHVIMENCIRQLRTVLNLTGVKHVSTHILPEPGTDLKASLKVVCGTNILSGQMRQYGLWKLPRNLDDYHDLLLMGVGFDSCSSKSDHYTRLLLRYMLSRNGIHSVRDSFAQQKLQSMGIKNVLNTGCPTMWELTPEKCAKIPKKKARNVICTVTDYLRDPNNDKKMLDILLQSYDEVYLWLQGMDDLEYLQLLGYDSKVHLIEPTLAAYDKALCMDDLDYVGTRLHAGIRALSAGHRSLIVSIDNRAECIGADTGLPTIRREDIPVGLRQRLQGDIKTEINMPWENISRWKNQFLSK